MDAKATLEAECTKEIDSIYSTKNKNQEEYDKQLLTLSSGFLALALAFIKDVVHTDKAIHRWLLYSSFVTLGICVLCVLASFQVSNFGLEKAKQWHEKRKNGDLEAPFPYRSASLIDLWNIASGVLFFIGMTLAISFVIINLQREATMAQEPNRVPPPGDTLQKGQTMKVPPPPPRPPSAPPTAPKK